VVEVDSARAGLNRDELVDVLWAENCLARKYFWPGCHNMEPYKSLFPHAHLLLPETKLVADRVFLLPTGTQITDSDVETILQIIRVASGNPAATRRQLSAWKNKAAIQTK
jgi:dTDP-4-amino-4,6-dideoxygalactose transaminase